MHAGIFTLLLLSVLTGCETEVSRVPQGAYSDARCAGFARERTNDADVNGVDSALLPRVFSDTYASCVGEIGHRPAPP